MSKKLNEVISEIRPALQRDGGDIELVSFENGVVKVKLKGACSGCPMAQLTLKNYVEMIIKDRIPGVKSVIRVE